MNNNQPVIQPTEVPMVEAKKRALYGAGCLFELTKWIIVVVIFFTLIHFFVATIFIVDGLSMYPNFNGGEYVIANRWQYNFGKPERGDVVILRFPGDEARKKYIKRIIAVPGDHIKISNGQVFINNKKLVEPYLPSGLQTFSDQNVDLTLGKDDYYLMGDNRPNSSDSRTWGIANKRHLIGRAWIEFYPKIKTIPEYKIHI